MFDFLRISTRSSKQGIEIYPKFRICKSSDLMIRGGDFYAIWLEDRGMWSTDEQDVLDRIDYELDKYAKDNKELFGERPRVLHVRDSETRFIGAWHQFCQRDMRDSYHMLDEKLIFSNMPTSQKDYASKRLPYPLEQGSHDAYDRLMSVLYSPEERMKIEWAIGSIVSGDSKRLQKFMVLYGAAGTGKCYSELIQLPTFRERFDYLFIGNGVGYENFGWRRYLNQVLYHSQEWKQFRNRVIIRDGGRDLACEGYEIIEPIIIHQLNPITYDDILNRNPCIFAMENVVCVRDRTHKAIHYGDASLLVDLPPERKPNDTCPWKKSQ